MSKHAHFALWSDRTQQAPKHSTGWGLKRTQTDYYYHHKPRTSYTPGKHAKPFGKHHPAQPITAATSANVIALRTAPALNLAA